MKSGICKTALLVLLVTFAGCSKNFEELNTNPNSPSTISPTALFTGVQLNTFGGEGNVTRRVMAGYCMMMVQQLATLKTDDLYGDKYIKNELAGQMFSNTYVGPAKNLEALIALVKDDPAQSNLYAMARIWRTVMYHRLTDLYGNIPYSQAASGYSQQIYTPVYDEQENVYKGMLAELESAATLLDAAKGNPGQADLVYDGKIAQWKKLAYSMMLRLGMRMSKVAPDQAKSWVAKAIAGGVFETTADNANIKFDGQREVTSNPLAFAFQKFDLIALGDIKISKTLMDRLKATADPRLAAYSALPNGNADIAVQKGLPNGYNATTIGGTPGGADLATYSNPNKATFLKLTAPVSIISAAEVKLLLAEAAVRGWGNGNAAQLYAEAIDASMAQQADYGAAMSPAAVTAYKAAVPFPAAGSETDKLKVINEEFWVATYMNGLESYANWRRSGYPLLTPVNYPGNNANGQVPRRLVYPRSEAASNGKNLSAAISQQGADEFTTRIWWDKQ